jgi:SAM-dependent methyltransferase
MTFRNVYEDAERADAYSRLGFPGTYFLAYRDLPSILERHVSGRRAVDFGCGAGRSTRFLRGLGFTVVGIDISADMVRKAREIDPSGDYRLAEPAGLAGLAEGSWDLALSAFTFDNVPQPQKVVHFRGLARLLAPEGRIVNLVSTPEIYTHEWASFSTRDFPENHRAKSGDVVRIVMTDVTDSRPVEDVVCTKASYLEIYREAGLGVVASHEPLGREDEPFAWVDETCVAPWRIDVLKRPEGPADPSGAARRRSLGTRADGSPLSASTPGRRRPRGLSGP